MVSAKRFELPGQRKEEMTALNTAGLSYATPDRNVRTKCQGSCKCVAMATVWVLSLQPKAVKKL